MRINLKLFYIGVFVVIQVIMFLCVWLRRVKSKMLIKILNQFIHYFNSRFLFKSCGCKVSRWKIQNSSVASWSFGSQWPITDYTEGNVQLTFLAYIHVSFSIQFNIRFVLIKSKAKPRRSRPYLLFKICLACQ